MLPIAVNVLEVVEGVILMVPAFDDDRRIHLSVQVLEASESRSNLVGDDPMEMMCCRNVWDRSEMQVRVVDQATSGIW